MTIKYIIKENIIKSPISSFIATSLVVIYLLFNMNILSEIPCGKNIGNVFFSNFTHIEYSHLISNIYSLYAISRIERQLGMKKFICLLIFLLMFNTIVTWLARLYIKNWNCSIGFSGILFGLLSWEIFSNKSVDINIIISIVILVITPSINGKNISFIGHLLGAISGIIGGLLWKILVKKGF